MVKAVIWIGGLGAFAYLIARWHMLHEAAVLAFLVAAVLWLLGGLAIVGKGIKSTFDSRVKAEAAQMAASARRAQQEQSERP